MIYFNLFACWCFWSVRKRLIYDLLWNVANSGLLTVLTFSFSPCTRTKILFLNGGLLWPLPPLRGVPPRQVLHLDPDLPKIQRQCESICSAPIVTLDVMSRLWTLKLNVCLFKWIETKEALFFPCYLLTYFSYCQPLLHIWTFSISFTYLYNMLQKISIVLRI